MAACRVGTFMHRAHNILSSTRCLSPYKQRLVSSQAGQQAAEFTIRSVILWQQTVNCASRQWHTQTETICWWWEIQDLYTEGELELYRAMSGYMCELHALGGEETEGGENKTIHHCNYRLLQACLLPGFPTGWYMCWFPVCTNKQTQ